MSGFVYYVEYESRAITHHRLVELGLADRLDSGGSLSYNAAEVKRGPGSNVGDSGAGPLRADGSGVGPGVVVGCKSTPLHVLGYWPDRQVWRAMPGTEGVAWVGYLRDQPPRPDDLRRESMLNGHWTRLGDGGNWLIPVIRTCRGDEEGVVWVNNLPTRSRLDDRGKWVPGDVVSRYDGLWDVTCRWFERLVEQLGDESGSTGDASGASGDDPGGVRIEFDYDTIHRTAVKALGVNYRLGDVECDLLGLLDMQSCVEVLNVMTDLGLVLELLKKKEGRSRPCDTNDGGAACTPPTGPASPSCGA